MSDVQTRSDRARAIMLLILVITEILQEQYVLGMLRGSLELFGEEDRELRSEDSGFKVRGLLSFIPLSRVAVPLRPSTAIGRSLTSVGPRFSAFRLLQMQSLYGCDIISAVKA